MEQPVARRADQRKRDAVGRTTGYGYDALSRQTSISNFAIQSVPLLQKSYTPDGLLASRTDANNHATSFAYDGFNRLTSVSDGSAAIPAAVPPSGTSIQFKTSAVYDTVNRPTGISWTTAAAAAAATGSGVTFAHAYNKANQRIGQTVTDNSWLNYPAATPTVSYTANALNQYTAVGAGTPTYDGNA